MGKKRDIWAEVGVLKDRLGRNEDNRELRKRLNMAEAAARDESLRPDYLERYPAPSRPYDSRRRPPATKIPGDAELVRAWVSSSTVEEAARKLGIPEHCGWLALKAGAFRKAGVELQEMHVATSRARSDRLDVDALNDLIGGSS